MKCKILKTDESTEYWFQEGCYILEMLNADDTPELSIARATVKPACVTRWHRLRDTSERYVVLGGSGRFESDGAQDEQVSVGDVVDIPPGAAQRITCTSETDLVFLVICTPRFIPQCYQDAESEMSEAQ